jgi:hypothetical protein
MGYFGIVHTGIKNSISARAYAFETFRSRTNLVYFRDNSTANAAVQYSRVGNRTHGIVSEMRSDTDLRFVATERPIRVGLPIAPDASRNDPSVHNYKIHTISPGKRNQLHSASPVWVTVQYGICLNAICGGDPP